MKKYIILGLVLFGLTSGVALAQSPSVADLLGVIDRLRAQLLELQQRQIVIDPVLGQYFCFNHDLKRGDRGEDVYKLYKLLYKYRTGNDANDYLDEYNDMLATWVKEFQEQYANEILKPLGLSRGTGYFGRSTRAVLMRLYCKTPGQNHAPIIHAFSGPDELAVGEEGTWTIRATDPENSSLSYAMYWGDEGNMAPSAAGLDRAANPVQQTATFTHAYPKAGNYAPYVIVTDTASNRTTSRALPVLVGSASSAEIKVLSPNGGETWAANSVHTLTWQAVNTAAVDLSLTGVCPDGFQCSLPSYILDKNITSSAIYNWVVATDIADNPIPAGDYRLVVCPVGLKYGCDLSDRPFTITGSAAANRPPTISSISGPTVLRVDQTGTWRVRASDPENGDLSYSILWGDEVYAADADTLGLMPESSRFQQSTSFTHSYARAGNFRLTVWVQDSAGETAKSTITVNVN